ncbi:hypothetical protein ACFQ2K_08795 [Streptomyces sanglieri]|uniref:TetR family transcriptional regulator n=1 Tax=Streptomyces sanglieri TaxID=193460 RepID=A0ABW2WRP1_9ACTN
MRAADTERRSLLQDLGLDGKHWSTPAAVVGRARTDPAPSASGTPAPGQRADARHNRARLLQAAREAYALNGTDVSSSAIARRAGVGAATGTPRHAAR